jgi:hypothetical protein
MMTWLRRFARRWAAPDAGAVLSRELIQECTRLNAALEDTRAEFKAVRVQLRALDEKLSECRPASGGTGGGIHG